MNTPTIRQGLIPIVPLRFVPSGLEVLTEGWGDMGFLRISYRATSKNIARLKAKIERLQKEIKTASRGRKFRLRKRLARAERRLERINRVVEKRVGRREAKGKALTNRQQRLSEALKRGKDPKKKRSMQRALVGLKTKAAREAKEIEEEDRKLAASLEDEIKDDSAEDGAEAPGFDAEFVEAESEKKPWERPEVLVIGAVLLLGGLYLVSRKGA